MDSSLKRPRGKGAWVLGAVAGLTLVGGGAAIAAVGADNGGHHGPAGRLANVLASSTGRAPAALGPGTATPTPSPTAPITPIASPSAFPTGQFCSPGPVAPIASSTMITPIASLSPTPTRPIASAAPRASAPVASPSPASTGQKPYPTASPTAPVPSPSPSAPDCSPAPSPSGPFASPSAKPTGIPSATASPVPAVRRQV